ncbi:MAG TPA: ankyrin repeat domain-containing protein [Gammaproteobacteria bacterium]|nr:ankyrin repeat domain-containing protein [Gammaproteobacteria bacterium]
MVARLLIEHGADVDTLAEGYSPLSWARMHNSHEMARLLIEHGANTDGIDLSWMN